MQELARHSSLSLLARAQRSEVLCGQRNLLRKQLEHEPPSCREKQSTQTSEPGRGGYTVKLRVQ